MGITQFADMSTEEFIGKIFIYIRENIDEGSSQQIIL